MKLQLILYSPLDRLHETLAFLTAIIAQPMNDNPQLEVQPDDSLLRVYPPEPGPAHPTAGICRRRSILSLLLTHYAYCVTDRRRLTSNLHIQYNCGFVS